MKTARTAVSQVFSTRHAHGDLLAELLTANTADGRDATVHLLLVRPQTRAARRLVLTRGAGKHHALVLALHVPLQRVLADRAEVALLASERLLTCSERVTSLQYSCSLKRCLE